MTHRDNVLLEIDKFVDTKNMTGLKCLELGAGNKYDFKYKFLEHNVADWIMTDIVYGVSMEDIPYKNNEFDLIFSCHAFEHCENPIKALREMKRVSNKWIIITTPHHCHHQVLGADEDHIFCLTEIQMKRLFKYVGIEEYTIYTQKLIGKKEQDYNLISIGRVKNE